MIFFADDNLPLFLPTVCVLTPFEKYIKRSGLEREKKTYELQLQRVFFKRMRYELIRIV